MDNIDELKQPEQIEPNQWFVMAPIYQQEIKIKDYLDKKQIRSYLPVKNNIKTCNGRKQAVKVPLINGLLFIYTTEDTLKEICAEQPYLHYKYDKIDGKSRKMVVPQKQMEDFLRISNLDNEDIIYFDPKDVDLNLTKGVPIRLHSCNSKLDGIEGVYIRVRGKREKRLVISLNGYHAVAMMINIDIIEKI